MTKFFNLLKKYPIFAAILAVGVAILAIKGIPQDELWVKCIVRILLCGTMLFLLYLISGDKTLSKGNNKTGYVIKSMLGFLIVAAVLGAFSVWTMVKDGGIDGGFWYRLIIVAIMFLFACLFEELCFRAVLNDAIIYQFRKCKGVFVISVIVTSLVFGAVHIIGSPLTSGLDWLQAIMKTLASGIMGFALLILYWKTRNIWACGIAHALYDFLTQISLAAGTGASLGAGNYVVQGDKGWISVATYGVNIVIGAIFLIIIWKKVGKTIDFKDIRENW